MRRPFAWLRTATAVAGAGLAIAGCGDSASGAITVVQTSRDLAQRLTRLPSLHFLPTTPRGVPVIRVDDATQYQAVAGVGAALTDSSAWLLETQLSAPARAAVLSELFGAQGLDLQIVRVPMGASDFTVGAIPYTYDDLPAGRSDPTLSHFSVAHDDAYIIPLLRRVRAVDPGLKLLATPWSPPAWMKSNRALDDLGHRGTLRPAAYAPLARYFVKFLSAYAAHGVPVAAITPQNEPEHVTAYPGLDLSEADQAAFISRYLVPALTAAGLHPNLFGLDSSWSKWLEGRALVSNPAVRRTLAGLAWHCYVGDPTTMSALHRLAPDLEQLVSECATGIAPGPTSELLIAAFRNWASAVVLWNLALDPSGGPVEPPNSGCPNCTAVVTVNQHTHRVSRPLDYFQLGQFSRFVRPGAHRVASTNFVSYDFTILNHRPDYASPGLDDVAFENPDGSKALLAYNAGRRTVRFAVSWHGRVFAYALPSGGTATFTWR